MIDFEPIRHRTHGERLLVKATKAHNETASGLLLPGDNLGRPLGGVIRALAKDSRFHVEQIVYFSKYSGTTIKFDNEEFFILFEDDIIGTSRKVHSATVAAR